MAMLIDPARWAWRGRRWAHLASDEGYDELHAFASGLGLPRERFHSDHYDVPSELRPAAIKRGAVPVESRELVRRLRSAGLRRPPSQARAAARVSQAGVVQERVPTASGRPQS